MSSSLPLPQFLKYHVSVGEALKNAEEIIKKEIKVTTNSMI